jgi:tellurite resistance protein TerC
MLAGLIDRFIYLKVGLSLVLVFVGVKMLLADIYKIPIWTSLLFIALAIGVSIVASLRRTAPSRAEVPLPVPPEHAASDPDEVEAVR